MIRGEYGIPIIGANPKGGANLLFGQIFPKKTRKMKKTEPGVGEGGADTRLCTCGVCSQVVLMENA